MNTNIEALVAEYIKPFRLLATGRTAGMLHEILTEQAETHAIELRAYEATVANLNERIRQMEAERVPEGWKIVPIEPTQEMVDSVLRYANGEDLAFYGADELRKEIKKDWELLLAAGPAQENV